MQLAPRLQTADVVMRRAHGPATETTIDVRSLADELRASLAIAFKQTHQLRRELAHGDDDGPARLAGTAQETLAYANQLLAQLDDQVVAREPRQRGAAIAICPLVERVLRRTVSFDHRKNVEWIANGDAFVTADALVVERIIQILVEAALVCTPPGQRIQVKTSYRDGYVRLIVRDGGPGLTLEAYAALFGRRRRLVGQASAFATARRLVSRLGGRSEIDSELGRGSMFLFELPARRAVARVTTAMLYGRRALVLMSPGPERQRIVDGLTADGCDVREAATNDDALRVLEAWSPDFAITARSSAATTQLLRAMIPCLPIIVADAELDEVLGAVRALCEDGS